MGNKIKILRRTLTLATLCAIVAGDGCGTNGEPGGVVAAASPEAVAAGIRILEAGGNAIDAAVAVQFALGVTEPAMSGLGGQSQILVQRPGEQAFVINGTSYSPANTPVDADGGDLTGHRATTIPATVKSLDFAWRNYGSGEISWAELLAPAITFADSGFTIGEFRYKVWQRHYEQLSASESAAPLFLVDGDVPGAGSLFRQPQLAQTLQRIATSGADDFYLGSIAREIAADMAASGGWITEEDLASVTEPRVHPPLQISYRDFTVSSLSPPGGGWVVLQILNLLEIGDPDQMRNDELYRMQTLARALRIGHTSRQTHPVTDLLNYETESSNRISKEAARALWELDGSDTRSDETQDERGETTHFTVVDGDGMAVTVTASINAYFGARVATPSLGFLYNDYMHEFELGHPDHPFALRPRSMPYSSMSPTIVSRNHRPVLALGSPGSARIISTVAQVTHRWIDLRESITQAVAAPRIHVVPPGNLYLESGSTNLGAEWLSANQFTLTEASTDLMIGGRNAYYGGVHAIALEGDVWIGMADPRRDGAVGYAVR